MNDMEKNQVSESEDFAAMLEETMVKFRPGQVVKGVVAQVSDDGVVVSIPGKADGFIKKNDLVTTDCKVDDELDLVVVSTNDRRLVLLSERVRLKPRTGRRMLPNTTKTAPLWRRRVMEAVNGAVDRQRHGRSCVHSGSQACPCRFVEEHRRVGWPDVDRQDHRGGQGRSIVASRKVIC